MLVLRGVGDEGETPYPGHLVPYTPRLLRMSPIYYWLLVAHVVARNAVPLVGILFDGWSAANVVVLYFLDTLLSLGVIFAALAKALSPANGTVAGRVRLEVTYAAVALFLCAVFALPLGVPVGIVLATSDFSFTAAFRDHSLRIGALVQCGIATWSYVDLRRALGSRSPSDLKLKQRFGMILMRWAAVLGACYVGLTFGPNRAVLLLLVVTYVAVSIVGEIAPSRLLRGTPADEAELPAAGNRGLQERNSANTREGAGGSSR
jgi:hypothetical protein